MTTDVNSKFIQLAGYPHASLSSVIRINGHEFVATTTAKTPGIHKYNIDQNEFTKCNNTPTTIHGITIGIAFDQYSNNLYLYQYYNQYKSIHIINMNTNQHQFIQHVPNGQYMLFINNHFHIFDNHNKHWIGTIQNKTINALHDSLSTIVSKRILGSTMYIKSKQCILLIGGYNNMGSLIDEIWIYSLISQKWRKIDNIVFEGYGFGTVLTSNQQYIILFGGYNDEKRKYDSVDNISVLDMTDDNDWKIRKSTICCPDIGDCHAVRTGGVDSKNEILVIGFIKQCFAAKEFKHLQLPPMYIMMLISKWYSTEIIHWLKGDKHFGIYLKDILSSLI